MQTLTTLLLLTIASATHAADWKDPRSLVAAALENNPTILRLQSEAAAARERVAPAAALPNPMLMAGVRDLQVDGTEDEMMTMRMIGASQTITRPSKRESQRAIAEADVRAAEARVAAARAEIEREVLVAWYDLAAADSALRATDQVREIIDAVIAAARVRYEVGTSVQADVIRAQLERSNLEHEVVRLRGVRRAALARLLPLLGLPSGSEVPQLALPPGTEDLAIDAPSAPPSTHPALVEAEAEVEREEEMIRLIRLETKPDIDIEAQYGFRRSQTDTISVVASIELPFRRNQTIEPRVREAMARRDAAKQRAGEIRRALTQALGVAVAAHAEATEQLRLHHEVLVPQARLALESTRAAYQTGKAPFDAILTTETDYLRLQLEYYEFLARHAQAVVEYETLWRGAEP